MNPQPILLANGKPPPRQPKIFELDGHKFDERAIVANVHALTLIYIAAKARAGDADAIAFANSFEVRVVDSDNKWFWPRGGPPETPTASPPA